MSSRFCRFCCLLAPVWSFSLQSADHNDLLEPGEGVAEATVEVGASSALSFVQSDSFQKSRSVLRLVKHSRRLQDAPNAVVTHICDNTWVPGALALGASLHKFTPSAEIVVMVSHDVSAEHQHLLGSVFDRVYQEQPITPHPSITRKGSDCVTLQLRTWTLPYKKALYMDADMIGLTHPDSLFDEFGELSAKPDSEKEKKVKYGWNGGMFMAEPKQDTYAKLEDELHKYRQHTTRTGIQQFLNHMYPKCASPSTTPPQQSAGCWGQNFSVTHNIFSRDLTAADIASLLRNNFTNHKSLHFSGDWDMPAKPWMVGCMGHADSTTKFDGKLRHDLLSLWKREFGRVKAPEAALERLLDVDCPAYSCAAEKTRLDYVLLAKDLTHCVTRAVVSRLARFAQPRRIVLIVPSGVCQSAEFRQLSSIVGQLNEQLHCVEEGAVLAQNPRGIQAWLNRRFGNESFRQDKGQTYLVDNSHLNAKSKGLFYYLSKDKAKVAFVESALWGSTVNGTDEGDGWVRTAESLYLPKTVDKSPVLRKLSDEEFVQLGAGHGLDQGLAEKYHQQLLKLAVADGAEQLGLSDPYVMWEPDALLLREFCPLNPKGQINFMEAADEPAGRCKASHASIFQSLTELQYTRSTRNNLSFSDRHMVVDRQAMKGLFTSLRARSAAAYAHWSTTLLDAACPTLAACACGFSEHGLYASWTKHVAPARVAEVAQQEGKSLPKEFMCCPHEYNFANELRRGFAAVKFSRSSKASCKKEITDKEKRDLVPTAAVSVPKAAASSPQTAARGPLLRIES